MFPTTHWSAIVAACGDDQVERTRALDVLITAYWKPVYKYLRIKWNKSNEDAQDLTQGFFTRAIEKSFFRDYDPAKARFRTFLRTCLDGFVANEEKAAHRLKRGGDARFLSLSFDSAESELNHTELPATESIDDYFEREWVRSFFSMAVETMRSQCEANGRQVHFSLFERFYLDDDAGGRPSYEKLATEFDLSTTTITNRLSFARREFRRIIMEKLREITLTDEEFQREVRSLLGDGFK